MPESRIREGYLVLADISGYTAFLLGPELEHAAGIIEDLTRRIIAELCPPMNLVKLEGDAVFCHAPGATFADAERLLELIEHCYCEFRDYLEDMARSTTCRCTACANIGTLDLKLFAHYGSYLLLHTAGVEDLAGPDVIVVHRMLKNAVTERTGLNAYALLTHRTLEHFRTPPSLTPHSESYESIGEISCGVHALHPVYAAHRQSRRAYIAPEDADFAFMVRMPLPLTVAWEYWIDPDKTILWQSGLKAFRNEGNESGRLGTGAITHCAHGLAGGNSILRYLDYRPFSYWTASRESSRWGPLAAPPSSATCEFVAQEDGSTVAHFRVRMNDRGRVGRLKKRLMGPMFVRMFRQMEERLAKVVEDQRSQESLEAKP